MWDSHILKLTIYNTIYFNKTLKNLREMSQSQERFALNLREIKNRFFFDVILIFFAPRSSLSGRIQIGHKSGFIFIIIIYYYYLSVNIKPPRHRFGFSIAWDWQ